MKDFLSKRLVMVFLSIVLLIVIWLMGYYAGKSNCKKSETKRDTVTLLIPDTTTYHKPKATAKQMLSEKIKIVVPQEILDSLRKLNDSLRNRPERVIYLPREQIAYKDTSYQAWVSGVQPQLDSIKIFKKTIIKTITNTVEIKSKNKPKPFGIGVQCGYNWNGEKVSPYVGIGVSYNFIRF